MSSTELYCTWANSLTKTFDAGNAARRLPVFRLHWSVTLPQVFLLVAGTVSTFVQQLHNLRIDVQIDAQESQCVNPVEKKTNKPTT